MSVNLGDKVQDRVSGFTGIATGHHVYLNGCVRISIEPDTLDKDGKIIDARIFDEGQLIVVEPGKVQPAAAQATPPGGPRGSYPPQR
jgi:hypothetical protein